MRLNSYDKKTISKMDCICETIVSVYLYEQEKFA